MFSVFSVRAMFGLALCNPANHQAIGQLFMQLHNYLHYITQDAM